MLAEMGFLGMMVPEEYGGSGLDTVSYVLAMEEVSRACASTSVTMTVQNSLVCWPVEHFGTEEQKRKYLVPLAAGESSAAMASPNRRPVPTPPPWQPPRPKTATATF